MTYLNLVVEELVKQWEARIFATKFNMLGALLLDKQLRAVSSSLSSNVSVRESFARINQICLILNLEKMSEVYEVVGAKVGTANWRLSVPEVKKVLGLRVEHNPDAINKLRL